MSLLINDEKRRKLVERIEKTAEEIRRSRTMGLGLDGDYAQLFLLQPRSNVYAKCSGPSKKVRMVVLWFMVVAFLISSSIVLMLLRKLDVI